MEGSNLEVKGSKLIQRGSKYKGSGRLLRKQKEEIIICDFLKVSFTEPFIRPRGRAEPAQPSHLPFTLMLWLGVAASALQKEKLRPSGGGPPGCRDSVVSAARDAWPMGSVPY